MKYRTIFDIIGPVMIGPSSSHTAGAARIGKVARTIFGKQPTWINISFYGSFAKTYKGHGTDVAIIGGILGFDTHDQRIINSISIAEQLGIELSIREEEAVPTHPNTTRVVIGCEDEHIELVGISIGGGKIQITELSGFELRLSGNHPALLVIHHDRFGTIAAVSNILAKHELNIGHMEVSRKEKGMEALMVIEVDQNIDTFVLAEVESLPNILRVIRIHD
ncbi:MAG: L-serine ammonia-lyase, iron-sulfur-dependent subunit beta [Bacillaceae bacterium]|nr:L-serine ammonia-lyase, iron-sulfur-dependent subunit beta [Bacillaceae bacterium]